MLSDISGKFPNRFGIKTGKSRCLPSFSTMIPISFFRNGLHVCAEPLHVFLSGCKGYESPSIPFHAEFVRLPNGFQIPVQIFLKVQNTGIFEALWQTGAGTCLGIRHSLRRTRSNANSAGPDIPGRTICQNGSSGKAWCLGTIIIPGSRSCLPPERSAIFVQVQHKTGPPTARRPLPEAIPRRTLAMSG